MFSTPSPGPNRGVSEAANAAVSVPTLVSFLSSGPQEEEQENLAGVTRSADEGVVNASADDDDDDGVVAMPGDEDAHREGRR